MVVEVQNRAPRIANFHLTTVTLSIASSFNLYLTILNPHFDTHCEGTFHNMRNCGHLRFNLNFNMNNHLDRLDQMRSSNASYKFIKLNSQL